MNRHPRRGAINAAKPRVGQLTWPFLIGIILLAAFLRLHQIDRLPPGDDYDPAYYGVDALRILQGERPIFLTTNFGREPLFSYLVAACFAIVGPGSLGIHLASAVVGILTVPLVYLMADEMFSTEEGSLALVGGPLAALSVAISYWHLNWSRSGVRAILVPLFVALTLYLLWKGLNTGRLWAYAGCGLSLGLSMYTYQAARLLPVLVLLGFACAARSGQSLAQNGWQGLLLVFLVALVAFAPLGHYFLTHPGTFTQRIGQALVLDSSQEPVGNLRIFLGRVVDTLLLFSFRGDYEPFSTIPGRPLLNPFLSVVFVLGIGISLLRIKGPPYLFLLIWLGLMTAPATLSQYGAAAKRAIGALPAVAMLITVGALGTYDALRRWTVRRPPSRTRPPGLVREGKRLLQYGLPLVLTAGFAYSGFVTYRDYFLIWGRDPNLFKHFEVGISAVGEYIGDLPPDEPVYLSPVPPDHPGVLLHSGMRQGVKGYNGRVCVVLPTHTTSNTTHVIVPGDDANSLPLLERYFPQGEIEGQGPSYYGQPYFLAYRIPAGVATQVKPSHRAQATWGDRIQLLGYDLNGPAFRAGETIQLTLYYRGLREMDADYTVFTHLLGPPNPATDGPLWSQDDSEPCRQCYPTSSWDPREVLMDRFSLSIPEGAPAGDYDLTMGFYRWPTLERLPAQDAAGRAAADGTITLGQVRVTERGE